MKQIFGILIFISIYLINEPSVSSQVLDPVKWEFSAKVKNAEEAELLFKAKIDEPWHIYAQEPNGGYNPTSFTFEEGTEFDLLGKVQEPGNFKKTHDEIMQIDYNLYSHEVIFKQKIKIKSDKSFEVKGNVTFFSCDDKKCLPPKDEEFVIKIVPVAKGLSSNEVPVQQAQSENIDSNIVPGSTQSFEKEENFNMVNEKNEAKSNHSLLYLFIISFLGGLGALLTPCVYPIIPLTVSFFIRSAGQNRKKAISTGILFSLSIILIYSSLGLFMGLLQIDLTGPVASHWLANTIFFLIFIIFAFSFFGMFELVLPGSWTNSIDARADKGGLLGIFFMALATVLISFSCTGPIIGRLIFESLEGKILQPVIGMFAFGLAFSIPFPILAIFPDLVKNMPKSGGWMNSVKIFFAFIMLAFSMKFLNNIDDVLNWNILTRELFISIWIILATLLGLYFLGKIKFSHDSELSFISVPRFLLSLASFSFAVVLFTGLLGSDELKGLSAVLPEKSASPSNKLHSTNQFQGPISDSSVPQLCGIPKYSEFLHLPHGLQGYFDIEEGFACASEQNKPVFLDFKGHVCTNCKEMEQKVWSDPRVLQRLKDNYILIGIFTDDRTKLPEEKWYTSTVDGKIKKTMGKQNLDYQITRFQTNSIPYYVLADNEGNPLTEPMGYNLDVEAFINFLDQGIQNYKKE